jgi:hypothetical protein
VLYSSNKRRSSWISDAHNRWLDVDDDIPAQVAAAALRAAADQVVPEEAQPADFLDHALAAEINQRRVTRAELLSIAAELEAHS